jgi:hypothetical protein
MRLTLGVGLLLASVAGAQEERVDVVLRDGAVLTARTLRGDDTSGYDAELGNGARRRLPANDVVAVLGRATSVPALPVVMLAGGDVVRGALAGGDTGGNELELVSPVLGRVVVAVDRVEAFGAPGVASPLRYRLPDEVAEALFVRAGSGTAFDVVAGGLHQFGENGVRFQPAGAPAPRWYPVDELLALRLRGATARESAAGATLLTRVGDRLGVTVRSFGADGVHCELEGGTAVTVRLPDFAGIAFQRDVTFLSDLEPIRVEEAGYDGEVVHPFRRDHNVLGSALVSGGRAYPKGLGVHSRSRLTFRVPAGVAHFWTRVAFDDGVAALGLEPGADVRVRVGDKVVLERKDLRAGQAPVDTGLVPVRVGDTIVLEVEPGRGRDLGDRIGWLLPMLLPRAARRP